MATAASDAQLEPPKGLVLLLWNPETWPFGGVWSASYYQQLFYLCSSIFKCTYMRNPGCLMKLTLRKGTTNAGKVCACVCSRVHASLWVCLNSHLGILRDTGGLRCLGPSQPPIWLQSLVVFSSGTLSSKHLGRYVRPTLHVLNPCSTQMPLLPVDVSVLRKCGAMWVWDGFEWQNSKRILWITPRV